MKKNYLKYINKIEKNRKRNNINWMNILRIAMENAPNKTKKLLDNIHLLRTLNIKFEQNFITFECIT